MRIAELADLTGTTVRAVRHYHAVGLLPVPEVREGWRDYGLHHVARVSRIRWLSEAGLSLATIRELLADPEPGGAAADPHDGAISDLRAALAALEDQLTRLRHQRVRLARLAEIAESGRSLTPMPVVATTFYDRLEAAAPDSRTRRAIRHERDFVELAYYREEIPPEAELLFSALDDAALAESVAAFGRDRDRPLSSDEVEQLAADIVARMMKRLGEAVAGAAGTLELDRVRRTYELFARTVDAGDRAVAAAVYRRLEEAVIVERGL
ncbi:MerR family transcriptional regulator [Phycicoccus endophyticus]|uniref:MerR family transcriptional regulator n=1 Tax=Phycicoccus endophyticus TaxID=1690220 RepID=A0A7G9R010_9MICO|nr:MerR family transcriptional regulator [Phycicoccus endophyticus]NHI20797.1 MerR family transcriptional regulator [Phycicoccus endophyticus]QNN48935.1 MerR family transcriptional regulator [Phycicoccus endophyticus]GGL44071.1 hypothetical protein GCM10012283_28280 [Phycicoccus endophyticus]